MIELFANLPPEVLQCIATFLTAEEIRQLRSTCTKVRFALDLIYWRNCVVRLPVITNKSETSLLESPLLESPLLESPLLESRQLVYLKTPSYNNYFWPVVPWRVFQNPEKYSWFLQDRVLKLELENGKAPFPSQAVLEKYPHFVSLCYSEYMHSLNNSPIGTPEFFEFNEFFSSKYPNYPGVIKINENYLNPTDICPAMSTTLKCLAIGFHRRDDDDLLDALSTLEFKNLETLVIFSLDKREAAADLLIKCAKSPKLKELSFTIHIIIARISRKWKLYVSRSVLTVLRNIPPNLKKCQLYIQALECQPEFLPHIQEELSGGLYCPLNESKPETFPQVTELTYAQNYSKDWHMSGLEAFNTWGSFPNAFTNLKLDMSILRDNYLNPEASFLQHINILTLNHTLNEKFLTEKFLFPKFSNLTRVSYIRSYDVTFRYEMLKDPELLKLCNLLNDYLHHLCQLNPNEYSTTHESLLKLAQKHGLNDQLYDQFFEALFNFFVDPTQFNPFWKSAQSLTENTEFVQVLQDMITTEITFKWLAEANSIEYLNFETSEGLYPSPYFYNLTRNHPSLKQIQFQCNILSYKIEISSLNSLFKIFNKLPDNKVILTQDFEKYLYQLIPNVPHKFISNFQLASKFGGFTVENVTILLDVIIDVGKKRNFSNTPYQKCYSPDAPFTEATQVLKECQELNFDDFSINDSEFDGWV